MVTRSSTEYRHPGMPALASRTYILAVVYPSRRADEKAGVQVTRILPWQLPSPALLHIR